MSLNLTKNADILIRLMSKEYHQRLSDGMSNTQAKFFGSYKKIQETIVPEWDLNEVSATLETLSNYGLLKCLYGDGTVQECNITTEGIAYLDDK